jgi:subtilisin family serine protease
MDTVTVDSPWFFALQWSDASGASANDYDLYLLNTAGTSVFDFSTDFQDGDDDPFESIDSISFNDTNLQLAITRWSGSSRFLWLNTNRGELAQATTGQTSGHATAANAFGVAATDWWFAAGTFGTGAPFDGTEEVESFSSDGPRRMFYDETGTPYTPGNFLATGGAVRQQPKVTAADGVSCAAPGFNPFFGTSAAAPHAAAIAALVMENSNLTPSGFEQLIIATALDIEAAGFDRDSGSGILMAQAAVNTTLPTGVGSPECGAITITLSGDPNDGPQTFRACNSITAGDGVPTISRSSRTTTASTRRARSRCRTASPASDLCRCERRRHERRIDRSTLP